MTTLAELEAKRAALLAARASNVRAVQFGEDRVEYKNDKELASALLDVEDRIARHGRQSSVFYFNAHKGL